MNENNSNLSKKYNKTLLVRRDYMNKLNFIRKLVLILVLTILANIPIVTIVNADSTSDSEQYLPKFTSPINDPEKYRPEAEDIPVASQIVGIIIRWLRNIGVVVGVLVLTIIGAKYMLAGAAEEKAQYKETLVPVVIGVVMLLGSITLISAIAKLME